MPGLFIDGTIAPEIAKDAAIARKLEEVCPVGIFAADDGGVKIVEENLDECTLCDLCLDATPKGSIEVTKLYES
jgi:NAD-dependent dihydropyrimidine dehydrogenase PreA subunit